MSYRLMRRVLSGEPAGLTATETLVLLAVAYHALDDGTQCWPSQATLARETRLSPRGLRKILERLIDRGVLEVLEPATGRRSASYVVVLDDRRAEPRAGVDDPVDRHHVPPCPTPRAALPGTTCRPARNHVPRRPEPRAADLSDQSSINHMNSQATARAALRSLCFAARVGIPTAHFVESRLDEAASGPSRLVFLGDPLTQRVVELLAPSAEAQGIELEVVGGGDVGG